MDNTLFSIDQFNQIINLPQFSVDYNIEEALNQEGLKKKDYLSICSQLKRAPNRTELGMFGVMWSEHCCYRNSKPLLGKFPTKGDRILLGPGENAGVVDLGDGFRLAFKIESHNHPSALEPFQGAATGVGGILRDIFTMGARPIALLNALRFGPLNHDKNISLMNGIVSGIAHYGNCVGVPTVGGEVVFDTSYSGNPLVNAMALGLLETDEIVCSGARGVDFPVVYVGSTTGRDGMGGASFASSELSSASSEDRPAVQVGDPFLEKSLIEACLEAFKSGDVVAAQDMGAAGLTCSCSEMASKGNLGIELDLDKVPARESGMTAYEFLLSESQERMLFVIKPGRIENISKIFNKWGLNVSVVGKVLKENIVRVLQNDQIVAELPASILADETPIDHHELLQDTPKEVTDKWKWNERNLPIPSIKGVKCSSNKDSSKYISWNNVVLDMLDFPTIASKKWIYNQYDHQVQSNTYILPGAADAAIIRLRSQLNFSSKDTFNKGVAAVVDCPSRWVFLDPERGSMAAVAESARNLSCVGAEPLAVTDNLNFSSPETPNGFWYLAKSCRALAKACETLNTPITGGNVSLYNETKSSDGSVIPIHPTPVIGMVGLVDDLDKTCQQGWKNEGDLIWLLGVPLETSDILDDRVSLSGSSFLEKIHGKILGRPPKVDLALESCAQSFLRKSISKKFILSAHDISDGGLTVALSECCIASGLGADCSIPVSLCRLDRLLFAEGGARILVTISPQKVNDWLNFFNKENSLIPITKIGEVVDNKKLLIRQNNFTLVDLDIDKMIDSFENSIPKRMQKKPLEG